MGGGDDGGGSESVELEGAAVAGGGEACGEAGDGGGEAGDGMEGDLGAAIASHATARRSAASCAAHLDTRLLCTPKRAAASRTGASHSPSALRRCSQRYSSTTCSLKRSVRATRRSPWRRPLRLSPPSLRRACISRTDDGQVAQRDARTRALIAVEGHMPRMSRDRRGLTTCRHPRIHGCLLGMQRWSAGGGIVVAGRAVGEAVKGGERCGVGRRQANAPAAACTVQSAKCIHCSAAGRSVMAVGLEWGRGSDTLCPFPGGDKV